MRVLLITGGDSPEREVSLISAESVKKTLGKNGHTVFLYDLLEGYNTIGKLSKEYDVIFPVLHGEEGEGGRLHEFLSKLGNPVVGSKNYQAMSKAWHKISFKEHCDDNNIRTAPWKTIKDKSEILDFGFPSVLKTSSGGSSKEVIILKSENDLEKIPDFLLEQEAFVEKFLSGVEVTVGILNGKALPVLEIIPFLDEWFSYRSKYDPSTKEIPFAPSLDLELQEEIQKTALEIHNYFKLGSYSRIDFIVSDGNPYALEVNTIPGLTPNSLMPKAAKAAGYPFSRFLEELIKTAS